MPFKQAFERNVNNNMHGHEDDEASGSTKDQDKSDLTKGHGAKDDPKSEVDDYELSEKTGRPPRFSALFEPAPPRREAVSENLSPRPKRKSGVFIPTPLFVLFAVMLLLESTLLFAYTIIGLYNNLPSRLLALGGMPAGGAVAAGCDCANSQAGIQIAPNFIMPGVQTAAVTVTVNSVPTSPLPPDVGAKATSTTSSPSTHITTTSSPLVASAASDIASLLSNLAPSHTTPLPPGVASSLQIITYTPSPQSTVHSTKLITVDGSGSTLALSPKSTVTSIDVVPPSASASQPAAPSDLAAKQASIASALSADSAALTPDAIPSSASATTLVTSASPPPTSVSTAAASSSSVAESGTAGPCFGGAGAVAQVCT